ncbi:MAG: type III secretion T3S chaperone [Rhabdochlamydiaceae bacterium]|nr:type III secretion T3S chaperone [Rhabdochlamydiaceae bacterium]
MQNQGRYPLEQLAIIKQKKLDEAEKALKEKKLALIKEEEKLKEVEKERDLVKDHRFAKLTQLREELDAGTTTDKIQQMKAYLKVVDEKLKVKDQKVKDQEKKVEQAKVAVETARLDFLKKQQDVEKLRLHREEWEKEMKALLEQKEAIETDEMGSVIHFRQKRLKENQ